MQRSQEGMERAEHGWSKMQTSRIDFSKGDDGAYFKAGEERTAYNSHAAMALVGGNATNSEKERGEWLLKSHISQLC